MQDHQEIMNHHTYESPIDHQIQTLVSRSYESLSAGETIAQEILSLGNANEDARLQGVALNALCEMVSPSPTTCLAS